MVNVSAVLIDMILEPVDSPVPTGLAGANSSINDTPPLVRQMTSEDSFSMEEAVVANLDFCDSVVRGPTSTFLKNTGLIVDLAGCVTVGVTSSADFTKVVTVGVTSLADPAGVVTAGVAFQEECEVQSGSVCDYDDYFYDGHYDDKPDYFNYDDLGDFDSYPSVYVFVGPDNYELYHEMHGRHVWVILCISGCVGVVPYWSGDEEGDVYEGDVALPELVLTSWLMGWGIV